MVEGGRERGCAGPGAGAAAGGMASGEPPLEVLRREVTCSICLGYFRDPVSIECGHNFCQACISQCWARSEESTACPQCRRWARKRSLRPNRELGNVVEVAKRLRLEASTSASASGGPRLCQKHLEPLKLFCEQDQAPVCVICRESRAHKAHPMLPVEEAAQDFKQQVAAQVKALKERRDKLKESKEDLECRGQADQDDIQTEKQKLESEFNEIHEFLEKVERSLIIMLEKYDKEIVQRRDVVTTRLSAEIAYLDALIHETEESCKKPASEFLQNIRKVLDKCKDGQVIPLAGASSSPTRLEKKLGHLSLKNMIIKEALRKCRGTMLDELEKADLMETLAKRVCVTLDHNTAQPLLMVSDDKKSVKRGTTVQPLPTNPERFDSSLHLLGCERISSGIHYWEVEVGSGRHWAVGIARESVKRKGPIMMNPQSGIWAVGLSELEYRAYSYTYTPLTLDEAPARIQVFVHYEKGWVAFFNADYMSLIFIFQTADFCGEKICPFFHIWGLNTELKMCP